MNVIQDIKETVSILQCAEELGYHPLHTGNSWKLKEHDSCVIRINNQGKEEFFWNSRGLHGDVIDFYIAMTNCSIQQAVQSLSHHSPSPPKYRNLYNATEKQPHVPFHLPDSAPNNKRLFAYLCKRGIHPVLVSTLLKQKQIFQDTFGNVVFTGKDPVTHQAAFACLRGTSPQKQFRMDIRGSKKEIGFYLNLYTQNVPSKLFVCESPIDCLSIATLLMQHKPNLKDYAFLSLGGTALNALEYHIQKNPHLNTIYLCQDNDPAGHKSRTNARNKLQEMGFTGKVIDKIPLSKDFNEDLQNQLNPKKEEIIVSLDLSEQAIQVQIKGMEITAQLVWNIIKSLVENQSKLAQGKQSLSKLNLQGKELQSVNIASEDLKNLQQHLKQYAVDFSIKKDPQSNQYAVFFKSQDIERVYLGLKKCVKQYSQEMQPSVKQPLEQTTENTEKNIEQNQEAEKSTSQATQQQPDSIQITTSEKFSHSIKPPIKQTLEQAAEKANEHNQTVKEQAAQQQLPTKSNRSEQVR